MTEETQHTRDRVTSEKTIIQTETAPLIISDPGCEEKLWADWTGVMLDVTYCNAGEGERRVEGVREPGPL